MSVVSSLGYLDCLVFSIVCNAWERPKCCSIYLDLTISIEEVTFAFIQKKISYFSIYTNLNISSSLVSISSLLSSFNRNHESLTFFTITPSTSSYSSNFSIYWFLDLINAPLDLASAGANALSRCHCEHTLNFSSLLSEDKLALNSSFTSLFLPSSLPTKLLIKR